MTVQGQPLTPDRSGKQAARTGADLLVTSAAQLGYEVCFANPGTTELDIVSALSRQSAVRSVLGLFEGVCTGAADGYARMAGKPALTLLHLGPGLANGLAYLHDAKRAFTPVVNIVGDHPVWHYKNDAPLHSDIAAIAGAVSVWVGTVYTVHEIPELLATATDAAIANAGVATLILPCDIQKREVVGTPPLRRPLRISDHRAGAVRKAAELLQPGAILLLGGRALSRRGLNAAASIEAATGCRLLAERQPAWCERGSHLPSPERLNYFPDTLMPQFADASTVVVAGGREPVTFFAWGGEDETRPIPSSATVFNLAAPGEDVEAALLALADAVDARPLPTPFHPGPAMPADGPLTPDNLAEALAALQPEGTILVDEGVTTSRPYFDAAAGAPAHTYLGNRGGAIGQGMPCSIGSAIACPDRPVVTIQADGSGVFTVQALWTQAREQLNVTTLICSNRSYAVLKQELGRAGADLSADTVRDLTELQRPRIDWVSLAAGFGVPGKRVSRVSEFADAFRAALAEPGPHLIELDLAKP